MKRGQIWWAALPEPTGSEPGYRRPVIIVQADNFNRSNINTVVVVVITSNLKLANAPGNVPLPVSKTGLKRESVANVSQITTLDRQLLTEQISHLNHLSMQQVDEGVRQVLGL